MSGDCKIPFHAKSLGPAMAVCHDSSLWHSFLALNFNFMLIVVYMVSREDTISPCKNKTFLRNGNVFY